MPSLAIESATVTVYLVADDHGTPIGEYSFQLWSSVCEIDNPAPRAHGAPFNSVFMNWTAVTVPALPRSGGTYSITLTNNSTADSLDWIGVESLELDILTQ